MPLEELEKKLYQKNMARAAKEKKPPVFQPSNSGYESSVKSSWPEEKLEEKKTWGFLAKFSRLSRKLFWILIAGIIVLMVIGGFYLYQYFTARDIIFSLKAPANAMLGVPFDIEVSVQNNFTNPLKDIKLSMILPEGTAFAAESVEKRTLSRSFGDLGENSSLQEKIPIIIFKNEQSLKQFEITASYFPPTLGPKARFEQTKSIELSVREPGIKLDLIAPQKVLNNEDFEVEIQYQNVSDIDFSGVELELNYPEFFTFKNATINPSVGNNFWKIGDLAKNSNKGSLVIKGSVITAEQSFFEIKGSLSVELSGQKYLISEKAAGLNIAQSPLALNITLNNQPNYLAFPDGDLKYKINFRNNSDVGLNDVVIKAKLTGEMFDFQTFRSQGFFNSKDNTVIWNTANTPGLRLVAPGNEGFVEFEIQTKETYPIKRVSDKNFVLKVEAEISSPTVPYYVASEKTIGLADLKTKVGGRIAVNSLAFFRDPNPDFISKGVLPPKVNTPTNFTIHWVITNYSTDVKNIEVRTFLQSGVHWTGQIKNNVSSTLTYNERTQEVTWLIDRIPATKGVISKPAEAIFQIEATPNITQIGQPMPLLSETILRAIDEFINLELRDSTGALATEANVIP